MKLKNWLCLALALFLIAALLPQPEARAYAAQTAILTFSDSGVAETVHGPGYSISGTTLTVTAPGTYRITGQCAEGSIVVGKGLSDVTLILDGLNLTASATAPLVVKKESRVLLRLEGESTLTDREDASTEETNADFEGACIKVKSDGALTVFGGGTLNLVGSAKNGLKGAALSALTVDGGKINVEAVNNAVAFDGSVTVNAGTLDLTADGDGLKSEPDETDAASAGTVTIRGGDIRIRARGDGVQAASELAISGGSFDIQTLDGDQSPAFNADTMSCKGLKASGDAETSRLTVTGGSFRLNTADDAIHSDGDVTITAGTFDIRTGDDAVHAEKTLTLGTENGYERDPEITVLASYEALEGSKIDAYSGKYYLVASDDGVNAAGGSSHGADPFGPGGGWGGHGGPGGGFPGGGGAPGGGGSGDSSINFYGGTYYVDCKGDGLDANGDLNLYGGTFTVLSMAANGDNSPLDTDGTMLIKGATVFGAGSAGMSGRPANGSQSYYIDSTRRSAGTVVNVSQNGSVLYSETLVRSISYLLYSSPELSSSACSVSAANAVSTHLSNAWAHDWDEGTVLTRATAQSPGTIRYTCACGAAERKTLDQIYTPTQYEEEGVPPEPAECPHEYEAIVTPPTCTETGYTTNTCAKCGDSYVADEVAALGHSFGAWTVRKAATCTEKGEEARTCARCGETETRELAALGHDYKAVVTTPTCTTAGVTTHTCTRCGSSYTDSTTAALGHDWDEGVITKQPTETSTGLRTYTCTRCGEKRTEIIPELAHVHSYTAVVTAPTCTEAGYTTHACACGDSYTDSETSALGHSFGEWAVTTAATCTAKGEEARTCARCDARETREIAALGHELATHPAQAPTCTEISWAAYETCSRCDYSSYAEQPALGHDPVAHEAKAATCTEPGWAAYETCSRCDYSTYAEQPALGHDYKDGKCTRCGEADPDYVNFDALNAAIEAAEKIEKDKYTEDSVAAFEAALAAAKEALKAETQAAVDKAKADLAAAVQALKEKPAGNPFRFDDVKDENQYFFTPVYWAYEHEPQITKGTSEKLFSPDAGCTRGQVVTFLWRAKGMPDPTTDKNPFTDVQTGAYYYKAVLWAVEEGVTTGTSATTFRPDQTCTRAQIVTFLWRSENRPEPESSKNPFTDVKSGEYYSKAVLWAVEDEITKGTSADKFSPNATCTRGQIVTFLHRSLAK